MADHGRVDQPDHDAEVPGGLPAGRAVADAQEYHSIGISEFILSGYPHLEEAYWFGEGVRPILKQRGLLDTDRTLSLVNA